MALIQVSNWAFLYGSDSRGSWVLYLVLSAKVMFKTELFVNEDEKLQSVGHNKAIAKSKLHLSQRVLCLHVRKHSTAIFGFFRCILRIV